MMSSSIKFILSRIERNDTSLYNVDLQHENINDTIAIELAHALCSNTIVQIINLQSNYISDVGATALAHCLCVNTTITSINLSKNCINVNGLISLLHSLQQSNRTVSTFDIRYNIYHTTIDIDNTTTTTNSTTSCIANAIGETLRYNTVLQHLHITVPITRTNVRKIQNEQQQQQQQQQHQDCCNTSNSTSTSSVIQSIVYALEHYNDTIHSMNITSCNNYIIQNEIKQIQCIIKENLYGTRIAPYKMGKVRNIIFQHLLQEWIPQQQ